MDEFSWFVGLYEGEGSFGHRTVRKKYKDKIYENKGIYLTIKMTDEDVIERAAKFLGVTYHITDKKQTEKYNRKTIYRVRKMGGLKGELYDLTQKMLPHLSKRRQEQIKEHLNK